MQTEFEWDAEKAASNLKKHGVSFDTAMLAFTDPFVLTHQDRSENGEMRWQTLGLVGENLLLLIAHTVREDDDAGEIIRIISARTANKQERRRYEREHR